jgi:DNA-binding XRE family transcriptional regulator
MTKLTSEQVKMAVKYRLARVRAQDKLDNIPTQVELAERWGVTQKTICTRVIEELTRRKGGKP